MNLIILIYLRLCLFGDMVTHMNAEAIIKSFGLESHPEGGFFKETYRSPVQIETPNGQRSCSTGIYFLLTAGQKSHLHRIKSDEVWHFYAGGPMAIYQLSPDGKFVETILGPDIEAGHKVQYVVPAGWWFGGMPCEGTEFSFVGCTVAPGFDFRDFEMAERDKLMTAFPHARQAIELLTQ